MIPWVIGVKRKYFTDKSTIGDLYLDGTVECQTLEDTIRKGKKVYGETAIPSGKYEVIINFSERFKRPMPLLLNVPRFEGVRLHAGNTDKDTLGCILVGLYSASQPDLITNSKVTFNSFFEKLEKNMKTSKVYLDIA